jgi:hypothetical protein
MTKSVVKITPHEAWSGKHPSVSHLRTFGCVAHVKVTRPDVKKLDDRSTPMVLLGYEPGSAAYRVYHPPTGRIHVSRDVVFDEGAAWDWSTDGAPGEEPLAYEYFTVEQGFWPSTTSSNKDDATASTSSPTPADSPYATVTTPAPATPSSRVQVEYVTPPTGASIPSPGEEAPRRYRLLEDLLDTTVEVQASHDDLCLFSGEEPGSFTEAEGERGWCRAMDEEMKSIIDNKTWELCQLPPGHRAIGLKWVYKLKKDAQARW